MLDVLVSISGSEISRSEGSKCTLLAIRSDPSLRALAQRSESWSILVAEEVV